MNNSILNRKGRFKIPEDTIKLNPIEVANVVFKNCIIFHAEYQYVEGAFYYTACSPDFDRLEEGEEIPEYIALLTEERNNDGEGYSLTRKWTRI